MGVRYPQSGMQGATRPSRDAAPAPRGKRRGARRRVSASHAAVDVSTALAHSSTQSGSDSANGAQCTARRW